VQTNVGIIARACMYCDSLDVFERADVELLLSSFQKKIGSANDGCLNALEKRPNLPLVLEGRVADHAQN
jgi:hypothetical protein